VLKTFIIWRIFAVFSLDKILPRVRPEFILQEKKEKEKRGGLIRQKYHYWRWPLFKKGNKKTKHETFLHAG